MSGDFERGFVCGCEWAITATSDLLEPAALPSALLHSTRARSGRSRSRSSCDNVHAQAAVVAINAGSRRSSTAGLSAAAEQIVDDRLCYAMKR
jgi:hypothetical protein